MNYRAPNDFNDCLLDTLAALAFLKATGHERAALIGHSFGGAVAINAGTISPVATTVIAISSQLAGAHMVAELKPKPLLLIHGTADTILSHQSSELIYERAEEPKKLVLIEGADHRLSGRGDEIFALADDAHDEDLSAREYVGNSSNPVVSNSLGAANHMDATRSCL